MSEEQEIVVVEPASDPLPSAPPAASTDEQTVPAAGVEQVAGTVDTQTFSSPLAAAVHNYWAERDAAGAPTSMEAFQKYEARRQAKIDAFSSWMNGTGPNPFEGHRF